MNKNLIRRVAAWISLATVVLYIVTGYGITQYRFVEKITFGFLDKSTFFRLHSYLIYPLLISLSIHLFFALGKNPRSRK